MTHLAILAALLVSPAAEAREPTGLHDMLDQLARQGRFSGAVVVRDAAGVRFARGYGSADPFSGRAFTPDTQVDSASLAKPVTAAALLMLAHEGKIDLDVPVQRYLPELPYPKVTVRHLLSHSAGLPTEQALEPITGKTNRDFIVEMGAKRLPPLFVPGTAFNYCNFCYSTLALLVERVSGRSYLSFLRERIALPSDVFIRPARLADWTGRAIGHRRIGGGKWELADSYDNELFYGTANFSISANQLAQWGSEWWGKRLSPVRAFATRRATIGGHPSGLSWGNWYCAQPAQRCHYLGHHEGFHHMLYWNSSRRIAVAMVSNNMLEPALHQSLQRALVRFAESRPPFSLESELKLRDSEPGHYRTSSGEQLELRADGQHRAMVRQGVSFPAYAVGGGIRYVPGLDMYFSADRSRCIRLVTLYDDRRACQA